MCGRVSELGRQLKSNQRMSQEIAFSVPVHSHKKQERGRKVGSHNVAPTLKTFSVLTDISGKHWLIIALALGKSVEILGIVIDWN